MIKLNIITHEFSTQLSQNLLSDKIKVTVKWFNEAKGFGFIESSGKDHFVHYRSVLGDGFKTLNEGAQVLFTSGTGSRGLQANDVEII